MKAKMFLGVTLMSLIANTFSLTVKADQAVADFIVKHSDGSVPNLPQTQGKAFCEEHGLRLPNARELASFAQRLGAKGILETDFANISVKRKEVIAEMSEKKAQGYYPILKLDAQNQTVIDFYYSEQGYIRPTGDTGNHWFWSSSHQPSDKLYAYVLDGKNGSIKSDYTPIMYAAAAVRCLQ